MVEAEIEMIYKNVKSRVDSAALLVRNKLLENKTVFIAIEGPSASGKSTFAAALAAEFQANLFHTDDYFLPQNRKTAQRLSQAGGNIDYERLKSEIIDPVCAGNTIIYRAFSCCRQDLEDAVQIKTAPVTILEGVYSMHPHFGAVYDLCFFLEVETQEQLSRILKRNGEQMLERFKNEWIPLENEYFNAFGIKEKCILI